MRAASLKILQGREVNLNQRVWYTKSFPPWAGSCSPTSEQCLAGRTRSWRRVLCAPAPSEMLSQSPHTHSCAIFASCMQQDVSRARSIHSRTPGCISTEIWSFTPELQLQNCVWRHIKTKTNQKMLLLGADSGGLHGPALTEAQESSRALVCRARCCWCHWWAYLVPKENSSCIRGIVGGN